MKNLFTILFCVLSLQCKCQNKTSNMVETELYQYTSNEGYHDIIQISRIKDSIISGKYSGAYLSPDSNVIFFFSKFIPEKINSNYDIVFELSSFVFTDSPVSLNDEPINKNPNITAVPFIFQYPITFLGEFSENNLVFKKITRLQIGSRSETMIFRKINN